MAVLTHVKPKTAALAAHTELTVALDPRFPVVTEFELKSIILVILNCVGVFVVGAIGFLVGFLLGVFVGRCVYGIHKHRRYPLLLHATVAKFSQF
jgi:hypothetical protein